MAHATTDEKGASTSQDIRSSNKMEALRKKATENPELSQQLHLQIFQLLKKLSGVFVLDASELTCARVPKHVVDVEASHPISVPWRRASPSHIKEIRQHVADLRASGEVRPSKSPWAAAVVLVRKKNGKSRLCCDYQALKKVTKTDKYPLPKVDCALDLLSGKRWHSGLVGCSGCHQLGLEESSKQCSAFRTPNGNLLE